MPPPTLFLLFAYLAWAVRTAADTRPGGDCRASTVCGDVTISTPFAVVPEQATENKCGSLGFQVVCRNHTPYLGYYKLGHRIQILSIFYDSKSLLVSDVHKLRDFHGDGEDPCHVPRVNTSSKVGLPFSISATNLNLFLYSCDKTVVPRDRDELVETSCGNSTFARVGEGYGESGDYAAFHLQGCNTTVVPVLRRSGMDARNYEQLIRDGFLLTWQVPQSSGSKGNRRTIGIALGAGGGILAIIIFSFVWHKHKKRKQSRDLKDLMRSTSSMQSYSKDLELGGSPHIFTYEELEKATDGFSASRELGDGGFGTVYKGKLQDGRVVAVKRLYKNNYRRVEQFVNEVDILSRLLHQNLVTLYGCTSRSSHDLLLVYEFIPNGTVADHLHGPRAAERGLTWPARMTIAIETAEALAYLHAVEIIHRDVKTNNILLDNSFHVKVADFGLSRLFPLEVTHVSTVPQGTPGYVDPVYHQCYKLTDKSDVYSFGVVLVELISSKPAVDMSRSHSDINLASMALNRIQNHEVDQLVDPELGYETDSETKRMIDLVAELAFQCLQLDRDNRPPIKEVVAVLHCIKNGECPAKMMNKDASPKEDSHLLKDNLQYSPDSVIHRFHSQSTNHSVASNSSG
ncbi:LEAF RUST 10 DISEASE-RESISTANCE LOCUS RECEPTOR-LIKE PROTEIN KINASE-like 1.2 isoform X7 [Oryza brachyantha]|uniref:LEAF RUST 10 DISEASE-RESISTANCE LOCUS RECEPTOR-LIKE PROTEIN KINASE-like 1.2 isoform X7 n=1 Tax=Oryza brachyantha TaxID=4533 RepID=UPI0003EAC95E|nr:LEAF RUST 10 DISEASE-RESISTANCE LOCUS RECEPTOR-LIKE PROTEIN KINASE-like 1.2 isoform X7 [Oryza brachyantha]